MAETAKVASPFSNKHPPIYEGERWAILLHKDQSYLGRCIVYLKSREIDDPLELTSEERDDLWTDTLPRLSRALDAAFTPDRLNYAHLANRAQHVHWHVVPRYEEDPVRRFGGETFVDTRVGKGFMPSRKQGYFRKQKLPRDLLDAIAHEIARHLA